MCTLKDYLEKRDISAEQVEQARKDVQELIDSYKENEKSSEKVLDK